MRVTKTALGARNIPESPLVPSPSPPSPRGRLYCDVSPSLACRVSPMSALVSGRPRVWSWFCLLPDEGCCPCATTTSGKRAAGAGVLGCPWWALWAACVVSSSDVRAVAAASVHLPSTCRPQGCVTRPLCSSHSRLCTHEGLGADVPLGRGRVPRRFVVNAVGVGALPSSLCVCLPPLVTPLFLVFLLMLIDVYAFFWDSVMYSSLLPLTEV